MADQGEILCPSGKIGYLTFNSESIGVKMRGGGIRERIHFSPVMIMTHSMISADLIQ